MPASVSPEHPGLGQDADDEPVDRNIFSESLGFKIAKWRFLIGAIGLLIAMVVVLVSVVVINLGKWIDPPVETREPDPLGSADFTAWTAEVARLCAEHDAADDRTRKGSVETRFVHLAKGRAIRGVAGTYTRGREYRSYERELFDLDVEVGEVALTATVDKARDPELYGELVELFRAWDRDGCVVISGDVLKPLPPVGGSQPSPCHPRYALALREIAFCDD